jgi:hypothetical protein
MWFVLNCLTTVLCTAHEHLSLTDIKPACLTQYDGTHSEWSPMTHMVCPIQIHFNHYNLWHTYKKCKSNNQQTTTDVDKETECTVKVVSSGTFQEEMIAIHCNFPDIRTLHIMCTLQHLANTWTNLIVTFFTSYSVSLFLLHILFPFHCYLRNRVEIIFLKESINTSFF